MTGSDTLHPVAPRSQAKSEAEEQQAKDKHNPNNPAIHPTHTWPRRRHQKVLSMVLVMAGTRSQRRRSNQITQVFALPCLCMPSPWQYLCHITSENTGILRQQASFTIQHANNKTLHRLRGACSCIFNAWTLAQVHAEKKSLRVKLQERLPH